MLTTHVEKNDEGEWKLSGDTKKDCGWELADYAFRNDLTCVGFDHTSKEKPIFPKHFPGSRHARYWKRSYPWEFLFPGSNRISCIHLCHAVSRPKRAALWSQIAKDIVDLFCDKWKTGD